MGLRHIKQITIEKLGRNTLAEHYWSKQRHWYRSGDKFVRIGDVEPQQYRDFTVYDIRDGHIQARYHAERARPLGSELLGEEVHIERYPEGEDAIERSEERAMLLPTARHFNAFLDTASQPQRMVLEHLKVASEARRRQGYDPRAYEAEYHGRLWFPFTVVALAFLAATFALRVDVKRSFVRALGELIGLALMAFLVRQIFRSLGGSGLLPPMVGAMGPCLAFLWLAYHRSKRAV